MNVVTPNRAILDVDEVRPASLLEAIYCERTSSFGPFKEPLTAGRRPYICTYDHMQGAMQWLMNWTSNCKTLVPHRIRFQ